MNPRKDVKLVIRRGGWRRVDREERTHREDAPAAVQPDGASAWFERGYPKHRPGRATSSPHALRPDGTMAWNPPWTGNAWAWT
jgi:hypothetical protein